MLPTIINHNESEIIICIQFFKKQLFSRSYKFFTQIWHPINILIVLFHFDLQSSSLKVQSVSSFCNAVTCIYCNSKQNNCSEREMEKKQNNFRYCLKDQSMLEGFHFFIYCLFFRSSVHLQDDIEIWFKSVYLSAIHPKRSSRNKERSIQNNSMKKF